MTSPSPSDAPFQPRFPLLVAAGVFAVAALTLFYPMFSGQFLGGSDQLSAGYAFRALAAQGMRQGGHIPQWNPYIFGGMPLWAVPGHFDVFYPTAWLRWIFRADTALTLAFFIHFIVAGIAMYALLRTLRASWTASVVGGLAYELTGALASQMNPGHDGKLFAAALAPFAFVALLRAIRGGRRGYFGWFALVIGLIMLTPHYLAAYYVLVGAGLFTLWLVFLDPERPAGLRPIPTLVLAALAVAIGLGIAAVELVPVQHMVAYTARGAGGESLGYAYASSWGMSPVELPSIILPRFNGLNEYYWGPNVFKSDTQYLGALVVALVIIGFAAIRRRRLLLPFGAIGVLFLMVSWGGYSPFYHLWILLPKMGQFRAPGLAFFMVALICCVFAGFGVDEVLERTVSRRTLYTVFGALALIAVLAIAGALQGVAEALAGPDKGQQVVANQSQIPAGGMRLLVAVIAAAVVVLLIERRIIGRFTAAALLAVVVIGDNWSILKDFAPWVPPASAIYADDAFTTAMKKTPLPFRAFSPAAPDARGQQVEQLNALNLYSGSSLMARGVPSLLGYHGMEDRFFDALLGGKNIWQYQVSPNIWDLYAVKYLTLAQNLDSVPGYHRIAGPVALGDPIGVAPQGVLFERDSAIRWVRVVPGAFKVADDQIPPTVSNPGFPINSYVLFSDTSSVNAPRPTTPLPGTPPSAVTATLTSWEAGAMTVHLAGADTRPTYLLIGENWYPDWHATIDGAKAVPERGDGALLTLVLPPGAHEVRLWYDITSYHRGIWISLFCLVLVALLCAADRFGPRHATDG